MSRKVLYPTDFSKTSSNALDSIRELKKAGFDQLVLLHVIDDREMKHLARHAGTRYKSLTRTIEKNAREELKKLETTLREEGFDVTIRLERGIPFREIVRVEQEEEVSLIVMGSHGMSLVAEMLLGSVSEKVIRHSKKSVLVVRNKG